MHKFKTPRQRKHVMAKINRGDIVDTKAPVGRPNKYGEVVEIKEVGPVGEKNTIVRVKHSNDEIGTYGIRQLKKTRYKNIPY